MLRLRVITALALLAVLLPTLWSPSAFPFSLFALALAVAGTWEWGRLCGLGSATSLGYAAALLVAACAHLLQNTMAVTGADGAVAPGLGWAWLTVAWVTGLAVLLPCGPSGWKRLSTPLRLALGWVVMGATWMALSSARSLGVNFLMSVMCIVWVSDICAYFAGHRWGRRRLAPTISPGKTWEGVIGACVGVLLLAVLWMTMERMIDLGSPSVFARTLNTFGAPGLMIAVAGLVALGVVGDLFESLIKRAAGVKDSSGLLPGHGGVLDRVDALLPVLPAAMALLALGAR